jgi:hypothetical protein
VASADGTDAQRRMRRGTRASPPTAATVSAAHGPPVCRAKEAAPPRLTHTGAVRRKERARAARSTHTHFLSTTPTNIEQVRALLPHQMGETLMDASVNSGYHKEIIKKFLSWRGLGRWLWCRCSASVRASHTDATTEQREGELRFSFSDSPALQLILSFTSNYPQFSTAVIQ